MTNEVFAKENVAFGLEPFFLPSFKKPNQTEPILRIISHTNFERSTFSQNNIFLITLYYRKNGCCLVPHH